MEINFIPIPTLAKLLRVDPITRKTNEVLEGFKCSSEGLKFTLEDNTSNFRLSSLHLFSNV